MPRQLALPAALCACLVLAACGGSSSTAPSGAVLGPGETILAHLDVKLAPPTQVRTPPPFALKDSLGRRVSLAQFRGKAVLLTFIYDHCDEVCPLIVADLRNSLLKLGAAAHEVQIVAVSVDPKGDTPATVRAFLRAHDMAGRMEYLVGSFRELAPVWRAYGIQVEASPDRREENVGHSAFVYGITGRGKTVVLYPPNLEPASIVHDAPLLASS